MAMLKLSEARWNILRSKTDDGGESIKWSELGTAAGTIQDQN
jgi:hypothetical protein